VDSRTTIRELDEIIKRLQAAINCEEVSLKRSQGRVHSKHQQRVHEMRIRLRRLRRQRVAAKAGRRNLRTF